MITRLSVNKNVSEHQGWITLNSLLKEGHKAEKLISQEDGMLIHWVTCTRGLYF